MGVKLSIILNRKRITSDDTWTQKVSIGNIVPVSASIAKKEGNMASEVGRLFIALEGALQNAEPDKEAREKLAKYIRQSVKQNVIHAKKRLYINSNVGA